MTKVKDKKGTDTGQFDMDIFMWKEKCKEWVDKAKHI